MPQEGHAPFVLLCTAGHMVHPHSPVSGAAGFVAGLAPGGIAPEGAPEGAPEATVSVPVDGPDGPQPVTMTRATRVDVRLMKFIDPGFRD